jgi:putative hydroxymethylpyrimidine transport system substrate-binding protein
MRGNRLIWAAIAAVALLAGCGGGSDAETTDPAVDHWRGIVVTLDGLHSAENVGLLMAERLDYFDEVDLGVELRDGPISPERPVDYVVSQAVDLAVSHEPQVVLEREAGQPLIAVGSLVPEPTAAMIWLEKSKIGGIADLKGKTVGVYGLPFERALLDSILARAGLNGDAVEVKTVGYETVSSLIRGEVDAVFGSSGNVEGAELETRGLKPVVTRVQSLGVPAYDELVVIARPERLREDPRLIPDFMAAVARGTAAAIADPKAAAEAIVEESDVALSKEATEASLEATLPLLSRDGQMDPDQASRLVDWMHEEGLIRRKLPVSDFLTNEGLGPEASE